MSELRVIAADGAPRAAGPYSQGLVAGGWLFTAGQVALDPATGELVTGDIRVQTDRTLANLGAVLAAAGSSFDRVVKTTCFLADMGDFPAFNEVYARWFANHRPARSTVAVKLSGNMLVEVEAVALV